MSEVNSKNPNTENLNPGQDLPAAEPKNTDPGQKPTTPNPEHMIPKSRFDEINTKYKDVQTKLDELLAEREKADKKAKEQSGKFEELYKTTSDELERTRSDHKDSVKRVQQLESVINSLLEAKLEGVPEEFRDLIPAHLTPEQKLDWLGAAEKKELFRTTKKDEPVGGNTNPAPGQTSDLNTLSPIQLLRAAYGQR
jgi:ribonucleoside-triphosphate reductase